jgi:mannose-6-phosphate isomerase-like protein (cupin superfamily)
MPSRHTQIQLTDVEDAAPANGFAGRWEARAAREDLDAEQTGLTHFRLRSGKRSPFMHRHERAEEVYVILSGTGRIKLHDEIFDVHARPTARS